MPGIVISIGGNSSSFEKEVAKAEAIALGMAKATKSQMDAMASASMARLKSQQAQMDQFRKSVDTAGGRSMMSQKDITAKDESIRQIEVEEATRRNKLRRILRQRAADSKEAKIESYKAEKEAIFSAYSGSGSRSAQVYQDARIQRRLDKQSSAAKAVASANFIGPVATIQQLDILAANSGKKAATGWFANFTQNLKGHGSGGMQQLMHVGRATFDSLASGMSPWRVALQQGPQALQAFSAMGGSAALKFILGFGAAFAAIGGIIAAPLIYLHRINRLAASLSEAELPDLNHEYIPALDYAAESIRKQNEAIADTVKQWDSATAAAKRHQATLDAAYNTQTQIDELEKQMAITRANGDAKKIEAIEKQSRATAMQRESDKLDADKKLKEQEAAGLKAEIEALKKQQGEIGVGDPDKHRRNLDDLRVRAEEGRARLAAYQKSEEAKQDAIPGTQFVKDAWRGAGAMYDTGGIGKAAFGPVGAVAGLKGANDLIKAQDAAAEAQRRIDRENIAAYDKYLAAERKRNELVEKRNKLQSESEQKSKRYAELTKEIADADRLKKESLDNLKKLNAAEDKSGAVKAAFSGGSGRASVTERERIGARSGSGVQISLLDIAKKQHTELMKHSTSLQGIIDTLREGGY